MPEVRQEVSVRLLPDGEARPAVRNHFSGRVLDVELHSPSWTFPIGALVEVDGLDSIFLGEVQKQQDRGLQILVEHYLDRRELEAIQFHWQRPAGLY